MSIAFQNLQYESCVIIFVLIIFFLQTRKVERELNCVCSYGLCIQNELTYSIIDSYSCVHKQLYLLKHIYSIYIMCSLYSLISNIICNLDQLCVTKWQNCVQINFWIPDLIKHSRAGMWSNLGVSEWDSWDYCRDSLVLGMAGS